MTNRQFSFSIGLGVAALAAALTVYALKSGPAKPADPYADCKTFQECVKDPNANVVELMEWKPGFYGASFTVWDTEKKTVRGGVRVSGRAYRYQDDGALISGPELDKLAADPRYRISVEAKIYSSTATHTPTFASLYRKTPIATTFGGRAKFKNVTMLFYKGEIFMKQEVLTQF